MLQTFRSYGAKRESGPCGLQTSRPYGADIQTATHRQSEKETEKMSGRSAPEAARLFLPARRRKRAALFFLLLAAAGLAVVSPGGGPVTATEAAQYDLVIRNGRVFD